MKQIIQNFKSGKLYVDDVPIPNITRGLVLVENKFSLISAGTEKGTVDVGKASMLGKAKKRPDLVKQVIQNIKKEGLKATYEKVKTKLDSLKALGYSTSGIVISSLDTQNKFFPGDRVACAGQDYASHAGVVSVPQNLIVKIPVGVSFEGAAFTTLGSIAMQGIRQAETRIGDNVAIIGLGLLGQVTGLILKASGCNVFGVDINEDMIKIANGYSCHKTFNRNIDDIYKIIDNFTNGYGFDSVIITAAAQSNDPIEFSGKILRKKGKVIIVGDVKMNIPRNPDYYRKELDLRMSCSYGPGRYDVEYEEKGMDYPYPYVRYTEQRNMETFLNLISNKLVNVKPLISHIFNIEEAEKAYNIVMGKAQEKFIGILLKYSEDINKYSENIILNNNNVVKTINVGFIGAGSFAQSYLLPNVKGSDINLDTVITKTGINAKNVAQKFGFSNASCNTNDIMNNDNINTVFIATLHDTHVCYAINSLNKGKHVFVEKPAAMNYQELEQLKESLDNNAGLKYLVGFNRRFSNISKSIKEGIKNLSEPLVMNFRINAGFIPKEHWAQDPEIGGGRIIGEICHFIDLMIFYSDSLPVKVYAECINSNNSKITNEDNIAICVKFKNGSIGNLVYIANADKSLPKEKLEISGGEKIYIINDWKNYELYSNNKNKKFNITGKGHKEEVEAFLNSIVLGKESPISFKEIYYTTLTTFKIKDSLSTGLPQIIE
jgi:predicted dehydrogenase/threonine dehydrogenase-like Zn-dependent dehydrogenase